MAPPALLPGPLNLIPIHSPAHIRALLSADLTRLSLISFWTPWAAPCTQMNAVVRELARRYSGMLVLTVEAEEQVEITQLFAVEAVPECLVLRGHTLLARISGADARALVEAISTHIQSPLPANASLSTDFAMEILPEHLELRMRNLMKQSWIVLFMKGDPDAPRCGFSRKISTLLLDRGVPFAHVDVLKDEAVRQGIKRVNDWPTFPQLVVGGKFVGGLDIVQEMVDNGQFDSVVKGRTLRV
ncbi:thioredoxin-like protein [Mycena amicta]|nr:thioredoxin-like protein [Mycena amicta]